MSIKQLQEYMDYALSMQTINTSSGKLIFSKDDVHKAYNLYNNFMKDRTKDNLKEFLSGVNECVKNGRTGFEKVERILELQASQ